MKLDVMPVRERAGTVSEILRTRLDIILKPAMRSDPARIGINIGEVQWAGGGLTHNLYKQLCRRLPDRYVDRLVSAENLSTHWLSTLTAPEIDLFEQTVAMARTLLAHLLSPSSIEPGVTTTDDLVWEYWQICADNGLDVSFTGPIGA